MRPELPDIVAAEKQLPIALRWTPRGQWLELVSPLDLYGVTLEGLRLCAKALADLPNESVTFQLEYIPPKSNVKGGALWRFEWRPLKGHNNKGNGPPEFKFRELKGSHHHPFQLNWDEQAQSVRRGNLPVAVPFPDGIDDSFQGTVAFVGRELRIENIAGIPEPPWTELLI